VRWAKIDHRRRTPPRWRRHLRATNSRKRTSRDDDGQFAAQAVAVVCPQVQSRRPGSCAKVARHKEIGEQISPYEKAARLL
jgi:hypothetical protein